MENLHELYCAPDKSAAQYNVMRTAACGICRFAAAAGAILTADFIGREYIFGSFKK